LGDKRQEGLTINRLIDSKVHCLAGMHIRLRPLPDRRSWKINH